MASGQRPTSSLILISRRHFPDGSSERDAILAALFSAMAAYCLFPDFAQPLVVILSFSPGVRRGETLVS